jgi:hypothetical protein
MKKKYFSINNNYPVITANFNTNSSSISSKNQQYKIHSIISFFSLLLLFLLANSMAAQTTTVFTTSGTWLCPTGVTRVTVEAWGGGGRGASSSGAGDGYGGGGGGAYAKSDISVTPGILYTVVVATGGAYTLSTTNGGSSYFINSTTILAVGGANGVDDTRTGALGGTAADCIGDLKYSGGNGGTGVQGTGGGSKGYSGAGGGGAGSSSNGNNANGPFAGVGGTGNTSGEGGGGINISNGSISGKIIGGGGGGAYSSSGNNGYVGAPGARGEVRITPTISNGPGGVTFDLQLWLRSDLLDGTTNTVLNDADVNIWKTQARGSDAIKSSTGGAPKYKNNASDNINFNSVVDFTNSSTISTTYGDSTPARQYLGGATGFYSEESFVVLIPKTPVTATSTKMAIFTGDKNPVTNEADETGISFGANTNRIAGEVLSYSIGTTSGLNNGYGVADSSPGSTYSSAGIISARNNTANPATAEELYYNSNIVATTSTTVTPFANVSNSKYWIGRSEGIDGSLNAKVAEVITYSSRTSETKRSNIRSYLAIKYGITLGTNGTSMNYTNSAGSTIWNASATGFNFDIAGIGRDDITRLTQKQSRSINNANDITIGLGDIAPTNKDNSSVFDNDKNFLVWGNNGVSTAVQSVTVNLSSGISPALSTDVSYKRISKIWKVVETGGDVSTCKISIPSNQVLAAYTAAASTTGDYVMLISNSPTFDATSEARIMTVQGSNLETTYNFDGSKYITFGYAPEKTYERCIQFDGVDDYLNSGNVLNLNTSFTVSAWVNSNRANQTILSKRNSAFTQGYDLSINSAGKAQMSWFVSGVKKTITSSAVIPLGIWHHIGVTFDGTTAKMYIDGINKISLDLPGIPTATTNSFLIAAADGLPPAAFFKGSIDEVRIWKIALTDAQFRYVMNQEIVSNAAFTNGVVVPNTITLNDISSILWTNLNAYYPMSTYSFVNAKDKSSYGLTAALRNINTVDLQTAPIPYESVGTGIDKNWDSTATWKNQTLQDLPNSDSLENPPPPPSSGSSSAPPPTGLEVPTTIAWNIVKIKNNDNITSEGNKQFLGLFIEPTAKLIATTNGGSQTDGTKIEVSHYLKLDGKIDLVGRSQLVQTESSDLDPTSSGSIERDQQGQANKFNYNYWSSPVGAISSTTNNNAFTVTGVLRDGTTPATPVAINWVSGYNGSPGSPISLAGYWIYKFDNLANDYANWTQIGETGSLEAGKGFTLKGSGAATATQNLTFTGKPNNGPITNTVSKDQLLLIGNPYPSALDADQFINDNIGSLDVTTTNPTIDGALYFWEHYSTNNTHNLGGYQGGYAIRNLAGGVASSSTGIDYISGSGTTSKLKDPQKYIPVGQGFFVFGNASGGNVVFKNSQRAFIKEDNATSQTTYRVPVPKGIDHWNDNSDDPITKDTHKKLRLGYNSYNETFHRQVLLAFMDDKANHEINAGYDAYNIDDSPSDMYLLNGENELAIQGEGYFDETSSYSIGVRLETAGKVSFGIDGLENFDDNQKFFIYDKSDDSYHSIKGTSYEVELPEGTIDDRFSLRFTDKTLGMDSFSLSKSEEAIVIVNQNVTVQSFNQLIKNIAVYDLSGRKIDSYKKINALKFTLSHLSKNTAGLIVKITLENDTIVSKKIIY